MLGRAGLKAKLQLQELNLSLDMTPLMNIIMTHPNLPESHSSSRITRPYLISVKFFTRKQPILDSKERLHNIFSETPVVALSRSPNLRDIIGSRQAKKSRK